MPLFYRERRKDYAKLKISSDFNKENRIKKRKRPLPFFMPPGACVFKVVFLFYLVLKVCFVKKPFYAVYRANKGLKTANEKIHQKNMSLLA